MAKDDYFEIEGIVTDILKGTKFIVEVEIKDGNKTEVECTISGKLRKNFIRIIRGDKVTIEVSMVDPKKGRIIWRDK